MLRRTIQSFPISHADLLGRRGPDIRRVVAGLDADNKAGMMLDSRGRCKQVPYGLHAPSGSPTPIRSGFPSRTIPRPSRSASRRSITARNFASSNFRHLTPQPKPKWNPAP